MQKTVIYINKLIELVYYKPHIVLYWRKRGPGVECPTSDPKVMGSNPGYADIGLHVFDSQHNSHEYWLICLLSNLDKL